MIVALAADTLARLTRHVSLEEIPSDDELCSAADLGTWLARRREPEHDVLIGGDVMLGARAAPFLRAQGSEYPFAAVRPLLEHSAVVVANLEGPLARKADREDRRYSYRVSPATATALANSGVRLVTLANNHLMDCGRDGVVETLEALARSGIQAIGAGLNRRAAHEPAIIRTRHGVIGVLGYYWNRRCAATDSRPGGAMDDDASLAQDISGLRPRVDLLIVTPHWGVPYERLPGAAERARARRAIDLGADAVIGHHPHVVQPMEVYRDRPIVYSLGNFAFGSGNTRAEGILVGLRCDPTRLTVQVYGLYVKNRDPRVSYQPKVLRGRAAERLLGKLGVDSLSVFEDVRLTLQFPWTPRI